LFTNVKTELPQPASAVNTRAGKSLAGFSGYPQLRPKDIPINATVKPTERGAIPLVLPVVDVLLLTSVMADIQSTSKAVPNNC